MCKLDILGLALLQRTEEGLSPKRLVWHFKGLFQPWITFTSLSFIETLEAGGVTNPSVNESKQEEDEPLATTSQKLDDERILEALEVHEKLK